MNMGNEYLKTVIQRFKDAKETAEKALEQLTERMKSPIVSRSL